MAIKQEENSNIRLVTGQTNPETGIALPAKGCIPLQEQQSGQFTSSGVNVIGDGSSDFGKEFGVDSWLYSVSLNEVRQVKSSHDKSIVLKFAFSADITVAEDVYKVRSNQYCSIVTKNTGAADALVQEVLLPTTEVDIRDFDLGCAPFTYDAQTSTLMFHISE